MDIAKDNLGRLANHELSTKIKVKEIKAVVSAIIQ